MFPVNVKSVTGRLNHDPRFKFSQFKMVSFSLALLFRPVASLSSETCVLLAWGRGVCSGSSAPGPPLEAGLLRVLHDQVGRVWQPREFFDTLLSRCGVYRPFEPGQDLVTASRDRMQKRLLHGC